MNDPKKDIKAPSHKQWNDGSRRGVTKPESDEISLTPFDRWLNEKLIELYGPVLREPIPDELIELLEAHRRPSKDN